MLTFIKPFNYDGTIDSLALFSSGWIKTKKPIWERQTEESRICAFVTQLLGVRKEQNRPLIRSTADGYFYHTDDVDLLFTHEENREDWVGFSPCIVNIDDAEIRAVAFSPKSKLISDGQLRVGENYYLSDFIFEDAEGNIVDLSTNDDITDNDIVALPAVEDATGEYENVRKLMSEILTQVKDALMEAGTSGENSK